jgi:hypothetical protein
MKKALMVLILICGLRLINGCGSTTTTPQQVASHFSVTSTIPTPAAGTAFNITVTALDANNSAVATYSGTVHFTSSDAQAVLPASSTITNGTGTGSVTLKTAGPQTVTVTGTDLLTGTSSSIPIGSAPASRLSVSPATSTASTGTPFSFTVTALDSFSNTATTYAGTVHFSSSDASAILPANSTLMNGAGTFSATLKTSGSQTIMATDAVTASITGTSFAISASGPASHFSVTAQTTANTRRSINIGITPLDASNNPASSYSGTVHITSSDGAAILPASVTLPSASQGFVVTLETPGSQTVTATDTVTPSIKGTTNSITVTATPALAITSGPPPAGTVALKYGPTNTIYEKCIFNGQSRPCSPCVPNTFACGGGNLPGCSHVGSQVDCILTTVYDGFQFTGTGGVGGYSWTATPLPPGLNLELVSFPVIEYLINGTPTPGSAATYNVMVTLSDTGLPPAPKTVIYPIVINNPPPPVVSTAPLFPGATVNQPFSYTFAASAGLPPYQNWAEKGALPPGITPLTSAGVLSGAPTMIGSFPITVTVEDSLGQMSATQAFNLQVYPHGFKATGAMGTSRYHHTATLLKDGTVLVAGAPGLASAEKYDPGTGKFTPSTGSMSVDRDGHTATLLNTGKVLITGGTDVYNSNAALETAEVFDPSTGMFTLTTGSMTVARTGHNATLLADGKVLITGGNTLTAELFDPGTGMFTPTTGTMVTARSEDTAILLTNGKVLITGGLGGNTALATAELYDPTTKTFSATTGPMTVARNFHTATLLTTGPNSGKVLIAGGNSKNAVAELYDPVIGSFSTTGAMTSTRQRHTATMLSDGTVLMAGGSEFDANVDILSAAELFDPNSGTFIGTGGLLTPRIVHTATLLKDGTVLVTGGLNGAGTLATAELYQ